MEHRHRNRRQVPDVGIVIEPAEESVPFQPVVHQCGDRHAIADVGPAEGLDAEVAAPAGFEAEQREATVLILQAMQVEHPIHAHGARDHPAHVSPASAVADRQEHEQQNGDP